MDRAYPSRINWENEPSLNTPINDVNLNKIDAAVYTIDGRVVGFDTTKANQSDLLSTIKTVAYNTTTGVFTFTYWNGQTFTVDLNIEAIPVSFSMSPQGVITMVTTDGSTYTADVSSLIKTTTLQSSAQISWTAATDSSGNKTWTGTIVLGSITESMLQPNFLADCRAEKTAAQQAADVAETERLKSEGWARGTQDGEPVGPTSPYYHDNAKYWKEQAQAIGAQSFAGLNDVDFENLQNGQIPVYNSTTQKWENGEADSPIEVIDALNSTSAEDALSANQGRVLKEGLDDLNTDLTKLIPTVLYKTWGEGGQPATITLSQPYTNFDMLIVSFRTNTDFITKLVDVEGFSIVTNYRLETTVQDANMFGRARIQKTSNPTVFNLYYYESRPDWALHPTKIVGIKFLQ